jgi:hypothetical protein
VKPVARAGVALLFSGLSLAAAPARAVEDTYPPYVSAEAQSGDATRFLPTTSSAVVGTAATITSAWGGYDAAARTPLFGVGTEVRLLPRLALLGGVSYGSSGAADAGLRPQVGARLQYLRQAESGVDATLSLVYRQDRFTGEDGLFQGGLAFGRSFGETSAVANLIFATDGEGDDHEAEGRLAVLRHVRRGLYLGAEGRYMHSVASTDPHRTANATPSMEALAGPVVAYTLSNWALVVEGGVSRREAVRAETGLTTLGGIGATF